MTDDFSILINNKSIIEMLDGDKKVFGDYALPYMSGPALCELSTEFGLSKSYSKDGEHLSRWKYMQELLQFLDKKGRVSNLLSYLFQMKRFSNITNLGKPEFVEETHKKIVEGAINYINEQLTIAQKELRLIRNQFVIVNTGEEPVFEAPKVKVVTSQYIRELPDRIKGDITNKDYDSVITKSRTLLEEVLIFIIEKLTHERYKSSGDLIKIYQEATSLLNMRQSGDWDKRVNELLGGLHKIVGAISSMRNMNRDAHGAGSGRIIIDEKETLLVAHSSMMLAEYWLAVYNKKTM
ncbi:MAG: abortive infection family protein [Bacteroidales bacterium]|nr:abortive infection family protein [Bacteroidales bacterium]